nr:hypothetical protein [uncultured Tolumonas sp.]
MKNTEKKLLLVSIKIYLFSLCLPAYIAREENWYGIFALILGPAGLFAGHFSWLANPLFFIAIKKYNSSDFIACTYYSISALLIALTFTINKTIPIGDVYASYKLSYGYYLWLFSMTSLLIISIRNHRSRVLNR